MIISPFSPPSPAPGRVFLLNACDYDVSSAAFSAGYDWRDSVGFVGTRKERPLGFRRPGDWKIRCWRSKFMRGVSIRRYRLIALNFHRLLHFHSTLAFYAMISHYSYVSSPSNTASISSWRFRRLRTF
jgi:hypothetical protein